MPTPELVEMARLAAQIPSSQKIAVSAHTPGPWYANGLTIEQEATPAYVIGRAYDSSVDEMQPDEVEGEA